MESYPLDTRGVLEMGIFYVLKTGATHSSILAWKILWTEPGGLQPKRSQRVRHNWELSTHVGSEWHPNSQTQETLGSAHVLSPGGSQWGDSVPVGTLSNIWRVFGCHDCGMCFWYLVSRGQGCASASNKAQDSPHPRKDLDPDANSAESGALPWAAFSSSSQADLAPGQMEQHFLNSHTLRNQLGAFI